MYFQVVGFHLGLRGLRGQYPGSDFIQVHYVSHIVFPLASVCLWVCLSLCLSVRHKIVSFL